MWGPIRIITEAKSGIELYRAVCREAGTPLVPFGEGETPSLGQGGRGQGPGEEITPAGYDTPYAGGGRLRFALSNADAALYAFPKQDATHLQVGITWAAFDTDNRGQLVRREGVYRAAIMQQGQVSG